VTEPESENLAPATDEGVADALAYALRFSRGRKRFHGGDEFMADLTAKHLVEHLRTAGFVVMKRPEQASRPYPKPKDRETPS
jgi:hypothetical protein